MLTVFSSVFLKLIILWLEFFTSRDNLKSFLLCFLRMGSSQAPYSVPEGFSNLASKSRRCLQFFFFFVEENQYSPYRLIKRVATPASFIAEGYKCINNVQQFRASVLYGESILPRLFNMASHYYLHCL